MGSVRRERGRRDVDTHWHMRLADSEPRPWSDSVPSDLAELIDPADPDLDDVIKAIGQMRDIGLDMTDTVLVVAAIEAVHKKSNERRGRTLGVQLDRISRAALPQEPLVYYMLLGNRVKIGFSANLALRLTAINPEELLAFEYGPMALERQRHRQFASLRTHGEWFRYEDHLVTHIAKLRATVTDAAA